MKKILLIITLLFVINDLHAQINNYRCYYEIGKTAPDYYFSSIVNFSKKQAHLSDFKGKWLILDFWNKTCSGCIASFPKINEEQKRFEDNVQFLLVGSTSPSDDKTKETQHVFEKLRNKLKLTIPCAFDSIIDRHLTIESQGDPFVVVIDPDGIVRGSGPGLNDIGVDLSKLTAQFRSTFHDYWREHFKLYSYDGNKPFLVNNNGASDTSYIYRSTLTKWQLNQPVTGFPYEVFRESDHLKRNEFTVLGMDVGSLYMYAFTGISAINPLGRGNISYGKIWPHPLFQYLDTIKLNQLIGEYSRRNSFPVGMQSFLYPKGSRFSYSLTVPKNKATYGNMMRMMRQDLANIIGLQASLEIKKMPYWKFITKESIEKLKTKGGPADAVKSDDGLLISFRNCPIEKLIDFCQYRFKGIYADDSPIINETGITSNIDLDITLIKGDDQAIIKALRKAGFDLVRGEREMKVLVLRPPIEEQSVN